MKGVGLVLKHFPGSRLVPAILQPTTPKSTTAVNSPPVLVPSPPPSIPMSGTFMASCDYCAAYGPARWVFDREQNEDRVACQPCREERSFDVTPDKRLRD